MALRFGTDGIRGVANAELTPEAALALGRAAARLLSPPEAGRARFLVGRDTRRSGPLLQAAFSAGLSAEGVDAVDLGVIPTPGVAWLAAADGLPAAVISASHNPAADNGFKFFGPGGRKLHDDTEAELERQLDALLAGDPPAGEDTGRPGVTPSLASAGDGRSPAREGRHPISLGHPPVGEGVGRLVADPQGVARYRAWLVATLEDRRLDGLRVVVDCANGAATMTAPDVLAAAGAKVEAVLSAEPDGTNINAACGSTAPQQLQRAVVEHCAQLGLAFDGDADRVVAVDEVGQLLDGDQLLALFALDLRARGRLSGHTVVVTVLSNLGFRLAMSDCGIQVHETRVGDRYVLEALDAGGWSLGGEQSGHIIFRDQATTGDGLLSGLALGDLVVRAGRPLSQLAASVMQRLPQASRSVAVADRGGLGDAAKVWDEVRAVEFELGSYGRVLVRPSGTEPVVRVMVEASSEAKATEAVERISRVVTETLGR